MGKKDQRFDASIAKAADFARPLLKRIRNVVHAACRDVEEDMKWGVPHFICRGTLCGMAAFKQQVAELEIR
jgi:hypothetical protein